MADTLQTQFASPLRSDASTLARQRALFEAEPFFGDVIGRMPDMVLVLNPRREIVFANPAALRAASAASLDEGLGSRPGELFACVHAAETPGGCGTTAFCRHCGAVGAILASQAGQAAVEECRMHVRRGDLELALDLRVWATPLVVQEEAFTLFLVADIADEKRRAYLEQIFLHDLSNTVNALRVFAHLLSSVPLDDREREDYGRRVDRISQRLAEEVTAHKMLMAAEHGELEPRIQTCQTTDLLLELQREFDSGDLLNGRTLNLDPASDSLSFQTDPTLLLRTLKNMLKNALEAALPGDAVTFGCLLEDDGIRFWVHNPTCMSERIRLQVFSRSFSTKGPGRGLGTYSMKLLTERYLHGRIGFSSTEEAGTAFWAWVPRVPVSPPLP